jgi:hypothetical protein
MRIEHVRFGLSTASDWSENGRACEEISSILDLRSLEQVRGAETEATMAESGKWSAHVGMTNASATALFELCVSLTLTLTLTQVDPWIRDAFLFDQMHGY